MNELYSYNYPKARKAGAPFSWVSWMINRISDRVHSEIRFSPAYKRVSFSCTNADGARCCRFKMIEYSHDWWDVDTVPCDTIKEMRRVLTACRMADVSMSQLEDWLETARPGDVLYGKNAIKYDLIGTSLSFISRLEIVPSSRTKQRCNETCELVIMSSDEWTKEYYKPETDTPDETRDKTRLLFHGL